MMTLTFRLELEGPSGSGKSTFINFIMDACCRSERWAAHQKGPHTLEIAHIRRPMPKKEERQ